MLDLDQTLDQSLELYEDIIQPVSNH